VRYATNLVMSLLGVMLVLCFAMVMAELNTTQAAVHAVLAQR